MKDIKELIYAAVEENAVAFQELASNILQARAYDAIEALRPEVGASMFGEAKECSDDSDDKDDGEESGKKSRKSKESDDDDSKEEVDESKLDEGHYFDGVSSYDFRQEQIVSTTARKQIAKARKKLDAIEKPKSQAAHTAALKSMDKQPVAKFLKTRKGDGKVRTEEVEQIDEVEHPKNQADMLAHILHQVKISGHPVATDAQFRASHGKDESKKASLEPPKDKMQYAIAQGGNVKP